MSTFHIDYHGQLIAVSQESADNFLVALPNKTMRLVRKQDSDGADYWFEKDTDNETPETAELGAAIEVVISS
ncbi:hypothetical protein SAMN04488128_1011586 [Chitinophaga eiseniae]|uniref:Uncharacterized protein n=1 Tax=Chitinophaga eiseniae TaxID=634771 RepID=A0A1T4NHE4_9BACT|nr:hypothetical protein [Chitinophaga eiseniae]SJZ78565.1 hypothetical protein SAMN04488128_1011586 [Chitinophaga eiseniae]